MKKINNTQHLYDEDKNQVISARTGKPVKPRNGRWDIKNNQGFSVTVSKRDLYCEGFTSEDGDSCQIAVNSLERWTTKTKVSFNLELQHLVHYCESSNAIAPQQQFEYAVKHGQLTLAEQNCMRKAQVKQLERWEDRWIDREEIWYLIGYNNPKSEWFGDEFGKRAWIEQELSRISSCQTEIMNIDKLIVKIQKHKAWLEDHKDV